MEKNTTTNNLNEVVNEINEISISDKLGTEETPKVDYGKYGICEECGNKNTGKNWCLQCNSQHFQRNFGNWTSENKDIDVIIQESQSNCTNYLSFVEWVPYSQFEDIKYIDKGGFGKIYSAIWNEGPIQKWNIQQKKWERIYKKEVALKSLNNSQNITTEFLNEFKNHLKCNEAIVPCFGITQDPETKNYIFVMGFMKGGNLRNFLKSNFFKLSWLDKLNSLLVISSGLYNIHNEINLIHQDFHIGNILSINNEICLITDLGLSKPADETGISKDSKQKIFGVIPYIAPEVLSGDDNYSKASDIYGFAMIMFEVLTGIPPFYNVPHDIDLVLKICNGYRPEIPSNIVIPQLLVDIMKRCWDAKSEQRPTAFELFDDFDNYKTNLEDEVKESEIYKQIEECNRLNLINPVDNNNTNNSTSYEMHPSAIYTSRGFNFENLPKPKNLNENDNKNMNELTTKDYQITKSTLSCLTPPNFDSEDIDNITAGWNHLKMLPSSSENPEEGLGGITMYIRRDKTHKSKIMALLSLWQRSLTTSRKFWGETSTSSPSPSIKSLSPHQPTTSLSIPSISPISLLSNFIILSSSSSSSSSSTTFRWIILS
ncbi:hypothetical protein Glove_355g81 [Diversispora epigaea]|uniref:Protein kinase domain-containing protein n=1 Tax=Diversispora epigaea TaxID=1348612 RepID=A0A397HIQ8_9GLOM|nr:hypothetical protein Glove_355g81 [Diversispora epigaea]